jgi:hypothetical protein
MPDFRIDDTAPEHRKMRAAGLTALGLWSMAGAWSLSPTQMTDGWIPSYWVQTWPGGKKSAAKLVQVGLWYVDTRDGQPGYQFHDWDDYQRLAAAWEDDKRKARERMQAIRSGSVRPNTKRTSDRTEPERAPKVHDSLTLTLTHSGNFGGEGSVPARASAPPPRCPKHIDEPTDSPCRACRDARRTRADWDTANAEHTAQAAADQIRVVRACPHCDSDGWRWLNPAAKRHGVTSDRCDHKPQPREESA